MKNVTKRVLIAALLLALLVTGGFDGTSAQAADRISVGRRGDSWQNWNDESQVWDDPPSITSYIYNFTYSAYSSTSITLSWMSGGNNTGFHVYRKCQYDKDYKLLGTVANKQYSKHTFKDNTFVRGIRFTYRIVSFQQDETTGEQTEFGSYAANTYLYNIASVQISSVKRNGKTKAVLKWAKADGVKGYEVYRKNSGSKYKRAKRIGSSATSQWTAKNVSKTKATYFKLRAYVRYSGKYVYGEFGDAKTVVSLADYTVVRKFNSLQKKFPDGKYWNHKGKLNWDSNTVTNKPCVHYGALASSCNYYLCPNGVKGYQCYGFAWKMSDLIYGRKAKIKNFRSFSKCRMGDVIRYSGHSVIIMEKHSSYIVVGECNAGNTCIISWGREVTQSELAGAVYSRRY